MTACVILAGEEGVRMRNRLPKVLYPVCGEPMVSYPVTMALRRGWDPVVVVISGHSEQVRGFLSERFPGRLRFCTQDPALGAGHAIMSAKSVMGGRSGKLAILYGDMPLLTTSDLGALERAGQSSAVAFLTYRLEDPTGYARVVRDRQGEVVRIVEHANAATSDRRIQEVNIGMYLVDAPLVFQALEKDRKSNARGGICLTDLIELARQSGFRVSGLMRKGAWRLQRINSRSELVQAEAEMNRRLIARVLKAGVTVIDPASTWLGPDVQIGIDTIVLPNCWIRGKVRIGARCIIGPGAVIQNARIETEAQVLAYSVLEDCQVGKAARVGPFARLRPEAELGPEARVGNFVEVKKSKIGKGSKANHLAYLGDATVGEGVNLGAGTITCNYDGVHKHTTIIENGVFIGSDTQLVAPVKIGKNSVIGAGTTVTLDVPADALAVSRVRQQNIPGYARRKRRAHGKRRKKSKSSA